MSKKIENKLFFAFQTALAGKLNKRSNDASNIIQGVIDKIGKGLINNHTEHRDAPHRESIHSNSHSDFHIDTEKPNKKNNYRKTIKT